MWLYHLSTMVNFQVRMDYFIYWIYGQNEIKLYILSSKYKIDINVNPKFIPNCSNQIMHYVEIYILNKFNDNVHIFFDTKLSLFMISICTQE